MNKEDKEIASNTPRTDAEVFEPLRPVEDEWVPDFEFVNADFARQLEGELNECRNKITDLEVLNETGTKELTEAYENISLLKKQLAAYGNVVQLVIDEKCCEGKGHYRSQKMTEALDKLDALATYAECGKGAAE